MRVGSLFSGIGGFDLGAERVGGEVVWQCEIDKDARTVLAEHWPAVECFEDVREIDDRAPGVDVLCGGFPCQDLSVAGNRRGLAGERSGLFFEFMRVTGALAPRWVLIENVPGLLSSDDGRDMGTVLGTLADLGYGWAYRVLDAQFFGVAQRRRRVFIVGCLGDAGSAAKVLFEPESCEGHPAPSREPRERITGTLMAGSDGRGWRIGADEASTGQLVAVAFHQIQDPITSEDFAPSLGAKSNGMGVAYPLALRGRSDGAELEMGEEGVYNALRAGDGGSSRQNLVAFSENQRGEVLETDYAHQLTTGGGKPRQGYPAVRQDMTVRRLTPLECERLQGFPDNWTACLSDSARYRTLGNAVAVPVAEYIGAQLIRHVRRAETLDMGGAPSG